MEHKEQKENRSIRGIRIRTVNITMILISCILYVLLISATVHVSGKYRDVHHSMDDYIACEESDSLLTEGSAYLTEQVRLYVVTGETQYMDHYFTEAHETRRREKALEQLKEYHDADKAYQFLVEALENSNNLMQQEIYAMKLVCTAYNLAETDIPEEVQDIALKEEDLRLEPEEMIKRAQAIVFSDEYLDAKEQISSNVTGSLDSIHEATHQNMLEDADDLERFMGRQGILISILFVENIITFIMIIVLIIKPLQIYVKCIKEEKMMEIAGSYEFKYLALTYNDIYEVNAANEAMLRHQAEHDPLTGIMNRGAFEQLKKVLMIKPIPLALLIVDVDKFKLVNDGYGHEVGDQVLMKVADLLQNTFRASDYPARIGGDEFAVILTHMTEEQQEVIEQKIRNMNDILTHPQNGLPAVSLSVGGAFSEKGFTENLYKRADTALYEVKEHGRCGCRFCSEEPAKDA